MRFSMIEELQREVGIRHMILRTNLPELTGTK
ncbi:hypothetical protein ABIB14_003663 [Arthrobacter sp. UYEF3]